MRKERAIKKAFILSKKLLKIANYLDRYKIPFEISYENKTNRQKRERFIEDIDGGQKIKYNEYYGVNKN